MKEKTKRRKNNFLRFLEYKIFHIEDSPHKIALGLAIGLFVAWTPILGAHILMAIGLSILLRANKFAAFVSVWVSNIFTFAILYYPGYLLGKIVYDLFASDGGMSREQVSSLFNELFSPVNILTEFFTRQYWHRLWDLTRSIGPELWIGCLILGVLTAVGSYIACYKLIKAHRAKNPHRRYEKFEQ